MNSLYYDEFEIVSKNVKLNPLNSVLSSANILENIFVQVRECQGLAPVEKVMAEKLISRILELAKGEDAKNHELLYRIYTLGRIHGIADRILGERRDRTHKIQKEITLFKPSYLKKLIRYALSFRALELWENEDFALYRVTEMTELIYAERDELIMTELLKSMPNESEDSLRRTWRPQFLTIRKYVSSVAPQHAKKGGRPVSFHK
jgi:hypothetical protein